MGGYEFYFIEHGVWLTKMVDTPYREKESI
jgi:hypothetical protein